MKRVSQIVWLVLVFSIWSQADGLSQTNDWPRHLKEARRIINGVTINLTPLIKWQQDQELAADTAGGNQPPPPVPAVKPAIGVAAKPGAPPAAGERPLKPWSYIKGVIVEQPGYGWVVRGTVDGQAASVVVLRNPPKDRLDEYNRLKAQLAAARQRVARAEANVAAAQKLLADTELEFRQNNYIRFGGDALEIRNEELRDAKLALAGVAQGVDQFETHGYDLTKDFMVQCFAMRTGQAIAGKPVYDLGTIVRFL